MEEVEPGECVLDEFYWSRIWEIRYELSPVVYVDRIPLSLSSYIGGKSVCELRRGSLVPLGVRCGETRIDDRMSWLLGFFIGTGGRTMRGWCASYRSEKELLYVLRRLEECASYLGIRGRGWEDHRVDPMKGRRRVKVSRQLWSALKQYLSDYFPLLSYLEWIPYTISLEASKFVFDLDQHSQTMLVRGLFDAGYVNRGGYIRRNSAELWRLLLLRGGYVVTVNEIPCHIQSRGIRSRILGEPRWTRTACFVRVLRTRCIVEKERVLIPIRSISYEPRQQLCISFRTRVQNFLVNE